LLVAAIDMTLGGAGKYCERRGGHKKSRRQFPGSGLMVEMACVGSGSRERNSCPFD
jgi:hypothetical protein